MNNATCLQPAFKKSRIGSPWEGMKYYIESQGGFIHDGITFVSTTKDNVAEEMDGNDPERHVKVTSGSTIPAGTELMRLPTRVLVTLSTVEKSSIGRYIFEFVDGVDKETDKNGNTKKLFNKKNDLVLALFLCYLSGNRELEKLTKDSSGIDILDGVRLYLSTLPNDDSYDNLPRRWSDEILEKFLTGTSLLLRVKAEKEGLKQDYQMLLDYFCAKEELSEALSPFPDVKIFDQMLSAVGSRAFDGLGDDNLDAMIPLLDLFDHKRGVSVTSDISYRRSEGGNNDISIVVTAKCDLKNGSIPGITYGAKGNLQLLARYGFTLLDNTEPDGSSNDVVEFQPNSNGTCIHLKRGPKAYTYGCFVKAIESFLENESNETNDFNKNIDDMEDFLNSCDNKEGFDEEDNGFDFYSDSKLEPFDGGEEETNEVSGKETEMKAIEDFIKSLQVKRDSYSFQGDDLEHASKEKDGSIAKYCAIVINSELQTLALYELAARCTLSKLKDESRDFNESIVSTAKSHQLKEKFGTEKSELIQQYAKELCETYHRIRHSESFF